MHRIDDPSASPALPTLLQQGTPGFFTDGSPTIGEEATIVRADWANAVQEEISYVIEQAGLVLSKTDRTQLLQAIARLTRLRLTAPITFYVSPSGNDANDGLTTGTAWASITHAYNYIRDRIDLNGFQASIQLADGTHPGASLAYPCVGPAPIIQGNAADPTRVVVNNPNGPAIGAVDGAMVVVTQLTVSAGGPAGDYGAVGSGLLASQGGAIVFRNMNFGVCSLAHIDCRFGGLLTVGAPNQIYTIRGGAMIHVLNYGGYVAIADAAISLGGTPNFSQSFASVAGGGSELDAWGCQFTGAATGVRYLVSRNASCLVNGAGPNYFPGNQAGTTATGGLYI